MDDSERSYGYSEDIYHGRRGAGGLRGGGDGPFSPDQEHWERSYEYGPEWSTGRPHPADFGPEEAAVRTRGGRGDGESWTWDVDGPHRGRGPEGYRRSDERIHEEICERLSANGRLDASHLRVRVDDGEVTLEGRIPDRRSKRLAEAISDTVRGVVDVHNRLLPEDGGQGDGRQEQPPRGAEHRPAERLAAEGRDPESGQLLEEGEAVGAGAERRS